MSSFNTQTLRNQWVTFFLRWVLRLSYWLPITWVRTIGRGLGQIVYYWDGRSRRVTERNIALAYPELSSADQNILVREILRETGALAGEMGHVWQAPWAHTSSLIESTDGAESVQAALASGSGVIVLGPHLGNWEVLGLHLATLGNTVALFEPPKIAGIGDLVKSSRERSGGELVPTNARGLATLVRCVRQGGISGILPDQVPASASGGLNVPFMGVDCGTASLGCNLIKRSNAQAFMGVALRTPGGFKVLYKAAPAEVYGDDEIVALTAMNNAVAELLKGYDEQYQWSYKRFRCRPDNGIDHYQNLKVPRARFEIKPEQYL